MQKARYRIKKLVWTYVPPVQSQSRALDRNKMSRIVLQLPSLERRERESSLSIILSICNNIMYHTKRTHFGLAYLRCRAHWCTMTVLLPRSVYLSGPYNGTINQITPIQLFHLHNLTSTGSISQTRFLNDSYCRYLGIK